MNTLIKFLLIAATGILLLVTYLHPISAITQDLGRHIKTGEIITNTFSVPKTNLYSYTYPDFPFINHHWGSEVLFYLTYQTTGFTGTLIITLLASTLAFGLVFWYAYKQSNIFALSLVSFLSLGILFERTDVRPEAFSFLFLALFLIILFKNRDKPTRWLYALIPLQLLWVNTHVYFIIGIVLIGLFFLDSLITHFVIASRAPYRLVQGKARQSHTFGTFGTFDTSGTSQLLFVLIICGIATLFNPNGLSGALYPFRVFENYGYSIEENQNIFFLWELFQKRTIIFFWVSVITLFAVLFLRAKHTRPIDWLLAITFTILGAQAIRNFPLYVFATFIPFTYHLSGLFSHVIASKAWQSRSFPFPLYALPLFTLLLFAWQFHYVITTKPLGFSTPTGASKAVDFMLEKNLKGPIFNNFDIGSYLIFRLYPDEKVFVDGRPEAYPEAFFQNTYIPMQQNPKMFAQMDRKYEFNTIFFAHTDQTPWAKQFLRDIVKNKNWQPVYLDDTVVILTKDSQTPLSLAKFQPTSDTIPGLYQLFLFFQTIEQPQKQIEILQQILQKNPSDCTALGLLSQTNTAATPIYQSRYLANCQ